MTPRFLAERKYVGTKFQTERVWLHKGDAFKWLQRLETESVDCFITDYPYESLEKHRKVGTTTRLKQSKSSSNEWFGELVIDPFMGSGSTGEAALLSSFGDSPYGCYFWGNDISPRSIEHATKRLEPYTRVAEFSHG